MSIATEIDDLTPEQKSVLKYKVISEHVSRSNPSGTVGKLLSGAISLSSISGAQLKTLATLLGII